MTQSNLQSRLLLWTLAWLVMGATLNSFAQTNTTFKNQTKNATSPTPTSQTTGFRFDGATRTPLWVGRNG